MLTKPLLLGTDAKTKLDFLTSHSNWKNCRDLKILLVLAIFSKRTKGYINATHKINNFTCLTYYIVVFLESEVSETCFPILALVTNTFVNHNYCIYLEWRGERVLIFSVNRPLGQFSQKVTMSLCVLVSYHFRPPSHSEMVWEKDFWLTDSQNIPNIAKRVRGEFSCIL